MTEKDVTTTGAASNARRNEHPTTSRLARLADSSRPLTFIQPFSLVSSIFLTPSPTKSRRLKVSQGKFFPRARPFFCPYHSNPNHNGAACTQQTRKLFTINILWIFLRVRRDLFVQNPFCTQHLTSIASLNPTQSHSIQPESSLIPPFLRVTLL